MREELKIRIRGYKDIEKNLVRLGAKFIKEINATDTYFTQPAGEVLKITEDERGDFLVNLKSKRGKFEIVGYKPINDVKKVKNELSERFGIKCILKKKRRFFDYKNYIININLIKDIGEFLVLEGENLTPSVISDELEIKNAEFITVSFDELKKIV